MTANRASDTLIITRSDIVRVMKPADYRHAAEQAFRALATGKAHSPNPMHLPCERGGFHAKGATISLGRDYVAVKVNGNFPGNPAELELPTIQGAILLCDGHDGSLLAILDSIEVTLRRTAAASALAAQHLAKPDSRTLLICGCGAQGHAHAEALRDILPVDRCLLWDRDQACAERLKLVLAGAGLEATVARDLGSAAKLADVIACCTTSTEPFLELGMVVAGTFIAAVGADAPHKNELTPQLMAAATVVTDASAQCADMGDLHHAIGAGVMTEAAVHAELSDVLAGVRTGPRSPEEIVIFDSTGIGTQDAAAAAMIFERCVSKGIGRAAALAGLS
jgi:ornithine cyclodeaminase/alanine dehydrogenase-like protein (mu-crystallin family)